MKNFKCYKKMLIVVDMINGFVNKGDLHDEKIKDIIPYQIKLIRKSISSNDLIVFIKDTHEINSTEHKRFNGAIHCIKGSGEEELIPEIKKYEKYGISYEKNSTCFMFANNFIPMLDQCENLSEVNIIGCCTDICICNGAISMSNYFDEKNRDVEIYVHENGIETFSSSIHDRDTYSNASKLLMKQQGIKLI